MSSPKLAVRRVHPEAFCVDLTGAACVAQREYVEYNHGRINEGGYAVLGRSRSGARVAWYDALNNLRRRETV